MARGIAILVLLALANGSCPAHESDEDRKALAFMETADWVGIFAADVRGKPGPVHQLDARAAKKLVSILDNPANFPDNLDFMIGGADYGFEFRGKGGRLILYCTREFSYFWTTQHGLPSTLMILDDGPRERMQGWKREYLAKSGFNPSDD
jgi:hypothetical protein